MSRILRDNRLWKSVENFSGSGAVATAHRKLGQVITPGEPDAAPQSLRACSACAGDYEDPDRTDWTVDSEDVEELLDDGAPRNAQDHDGPDDEFPAQED